MPAAYRAILAFLRALVRLFFRDIEVSGVDRLPLDRGGVIVSWHPNGLLDPGLILTQFPAQVVFGARDGLFKWPVLGLLLRSIGTVPILRAIDARSADPARRREQNKKTLEALARAVAKGSFVSLFPEGISHDEPHPVELKTGAAHLYFQACAMRGSGAPPVILPVGLHYDEKAHFRSRALVRFHDPIELPAELGVAPDPAESEDAAKDRAKRLMSVIERTLKEVVHATENWEIHQLLHRGRTLLRAERAARSGSAPARPAMDEKALGFARIRAGYYARLQSHPEKVAETRARIARYDEDLRALGLHDHELDRPPKLLSSRLVVALAIQAVLVFVLAPPVLLFGYVANGPTALLVLAISRIAARRKKDVATIKLLVGALLFLITWIVAGSLAYFGHRELAARYPQIPDRPWLAAIVVAVGAALSGALALRYIHVASETARALRVRLTRRQRRHAIERLRAERSALHDELMQLAEGLDLPGVVAPDGTVQHA